VRRTNLIMAKYSLNCRQAACFVLDGAKTQPWNYVMWVSNRNTLLPPEIAHHITSFFSPTVPLTEVEASELHRVNFKPTV
jgi:hypothetical protein